MTTRRVLILGGGDVGSAVAHFLFRAGLQVLIVERVRSPHARRGMAFTDALFDGHVVLDGVEARWVADIAAVQACWQEGRAVPLVTLPEPEVFAALRFDVLVDATMRRNRAPEDQRALAPMMIGLGPGYAPGVNCHIAIETQWGEAMGRVLREQPAAERSGGPRPLAGVARERFAISPAAGTWHTQARLGQQVRPGDALGTLGEHVVRAPIAGVLRGLARDGVSVPAGQRLIEVDPRDTPEIHGLGERPLAVARGVLRALDVSVES